MEDMLFIVLALSSVIVILFIGLFTWINKEIENWKKNTYTEHEEMEED